jgi:glycosyltransferase involved in cell wall biosynthesis
VKVAIVVNSAWAAYNFRFNLAKSLLNEGFEVVFIIPFDGKYSERLQLDFECCNLNINPNSLNLFKELKTLFNLYIIYKKVKPNLICHFTIKLNIYGSIASYLCGFPSIANITGLGSAFLNKGLFKFIAKFLYKFSLSFSSKVFLQNNDDLQYFLDEKVIDKSKIELLPGSGVDLKKFKYNPTIKNKRFTFLMISRVIKDKGIYEYIEAIKIVRKISKYNSIVFQILGEVNSAHNLAIDKSQIDQWSDEGLIEYMGTSDQVENYIIGCNCVVLPSYREGMPRAILEGFAIGRPCIVSDVAGCREIVEHKKNGLICEVKSSEDLANKMVTMLELSDHTREKYGKNGRKKIENNFDEKNVINLYLKSIRNILRNEENI